MAYRPFEIGHVSSLGSGSPRCTALRFGYASQLTWGSDVHRDRVWVRVRARVRDALRFFAVFHFVCFKVQLIYLSLYASLYRYMQLSRSLSAPSLPVSLSLVGVSARINDALHYVRERIACSTATATAAASRSPCPALFLLLLLLLLHSSPAQGATQPTRCLLSLRASPSKLPWSRFFAVFLLRF